MEISSLHPPSAKNMSQPMNPQTFFFGVKKVDVAGDDNL